jgi:hypothetical protein
MRYHFDVIVDIVFEEIRHLDNVGMPEPIPPEIIKDVYFQRYRAETAVTSPGVNENTFLRYIL